MEEVLSSYGQIITATNDRDQQPTMVWIGDKHFSIADRAGFVVNYSHYQPHQAAKENNQTEQTKTTN